MFDPGIKLAMTMLVFSILKAVTAGFPQFPISDELLDTIAVAIVGWFLSLFGYEFLLYSVPKFKARLQEKNLLPK